MNSPAITVLLPVYNAARYCRTSIKSILEQSFSDFELLIIDDGSTDDTVSVVKSVTDPRLRLVLNNQNMGVAETLNKGIDLARGAYVARMDADDVCDPDRLSKQFAYMEEHQSVGVLGTWVKYFGRQILTTERLPCSSEVIRSYMVFDNPINHPTVMLRKSMLDNYALRYDRTYHRSEDYHLWIRAAEHFQLANLPIPLLKYRCHDDSVTSVASSTMRSQVLDLLEKQLDRLGVVCSQNALLFHYSIAKGERLDNMGQLLEAEKWLNLLRRKNKECGQYAVPAFNEAVSLIWNRLCLNSAHLGLDALKLNRSSGLGGGAHIPFRRYLQFLLAALVRPLLLKEQNGRDSR